MKKHVVIVGAGIAGLCTAWFCKERGLDVTLIESTDSPRHGCSYSNAGMVVPSHFIPLAAPGVLAQGLRWIWNPKSPFALHPQPSLSFLRWGYEFWKASTPQRVQNAVSTLSQLHLASRQLFENFASQHQFNFNLTRNGLLMLCRTQKALDEESHLVQQARTLGIQAETLSANQLAKLEPNVTLDVVGAVRFANDCHLSPETFLGELQTRLEQNGARFLWNHTTTGWTTHQNSITSVQTSRGPVQGDTFVLCGGIQSTHIARQLKLHLPLLAGKGYSLTLTQPQQSPNHCAILTEARVAVTPIGSTLRVGGTMELGATNTRPNPKRIQGITQSFCQYFPAFSPNTLSQLPTWTGLRPVSPDGLPYLGPTRKWNNLQIATGHAMLGLSLGPVTGQIIAQLIDESSCPHNLQLLHPDRFG